MEGGALITIYYPTKIYFKDNGEDIGLSPMKSYALEISFDEFKKNNDILFNNIVKETKRYSFLKYIQKDDLKIIIETIKISIVDNIIELLLDPTKIMKYYSTSTEVKIGVNSREYSLGAIGLLVNINNLSKSVEFLVRFSEVKFEPHVLYDKINVKIPKVKGIFGITISKEQDGFYYQERQPTAIETAEIFRRLTDKLKTQNKMLLEPESPEESIWRKIVNDPKEAEIGEYLAFLNQSRLTFETKWRIYRSIIDGVKYNWNSSVLKTPKYYDNDLETIWNYYLSLQYKDPKEIKLDIPYLVLIMSLSIKDFMSNMKTILGNFIDGKSYLHFNEIFIMFDKDPKWKGKKIEIDNIKSEMKSCLWVVF